MTRVLPASLGVAVAVIAYLVGRASFEQLAAAVERGHVHAGIAVLVASPLYVAAIGVIGAAAGGKDVVGCLVRPVPLIAAAGAAAALASLSALVEATTGLERTAIGSVAGGRLILALGAGVWLYLLIALAEELCFRGVVMPALQQRMGGAAAVVLSAAAFAAVHVRPGVNGAYLVGIAALGLLLGVAYLRFGLAAAVGAHFGWDLVQDLPAYLSSGGAAVHDHLTGSGVDEGRLGALAVLVVAATALAVVSALVQRRPVAVGGPA